MIVSVRGREILKCYLYFATKPKPLCLFALIIRNKPTEYNFSCNEDPQLHESSGVYKRTLPSRSKEDMGDTHGQSEGMALDLGQPGSFPRRWGLKHSPAVRMGEGVYLR